MLQSCLKNRLPAKGHSALYEGVSNLTEHTSKALGVQQGYMYKEHTYAYITHKCISKLLTPLCNLKQVQKGRTYFSIRTVWNSCSRAICSATSSAPSGEPSLSSTHPEPNTSVPAGIPQGNGNRSHFSPAQAEYLFFLSSHDWAGKLFK